MKFYAIGGLGTDVRIYEHLELGEGHHLDFLDWPNIHDCSSLKEYAQKFVPLIDQSGPFGLIGVSMGGMLCSELSHLLRPQAIILISSALNKMELPIHFRLAGKADILKLFPEGIFKMPPAAIKILFGSKGPLMQDYIKNMDMKYCKKAAQLICKWELMEDINNSIPLLHIKGTNDLVLPYTSSYMHLIEGAGHSVIIENIEETNLVVVDFLKKYFG